MNINNNDDYLNDDFDDEYDEHDVYADYNCSNNDENFEEYNENDIELDEKSKIIKELLRNEELEREKKISIQRLEVIEAKKKMEELRYLRYIVEEKKKKEIENENNKKKLEQEYIYKMLKLKEKISEEKRLRKIEFQTNQLGKGFKDGLSKIEYEKIISPNSPIVRAKSYTNLFNNNNNNNSYNKLNESTNNLFQNNNKNNDQNNINIHSISFDDIRFIDCNYKWAREKELNNKQLKETTYYYPPKNNNIFDISNNYNNNNNRKKGCVVVNTKKYMDALNIDSDGNIIKKNKKKYTDEEKKILDKCSKKDMKRKPLVVVSMKNII